MISLKMIKIHRYKTPPRLCVLLGYNWGSDSKRKVIQCSMNSQNENETPSTETTHMNNIYTAPLPLTPNTHTQQHSHKRLFLDPPP